MTEIVLRHPAFDPTGNFTKADLFSHKNDALPVDYDSDYPNDGDTQDFTANHCPHPKKIHWKHYVKPIYDVNKEKFLLPVLNWGPNNQLTGLYESMMLARILDRTLVVPPFYRHQFDDWKDKFPHPSLESRVNPQLIREYVTTAPLSYMKEACNGQIDVAFIQHPLNGGSRLQRLHEFENVTGMPVSNGGSMVMIPMEPELDTTDKDQLNKGVVHEINDTVAWRKDYSNKAKCAIWVLPYMSMKYIFGWQRRQDDQQKMVFELMKHIQMPDYIMEISNSFIDTFYAPLKNFFAVHWRFDPQDWQRGCSQKGNSRQELCDLIESITPKDVAGALLYHMVDKLDTANHNLNSVFRFGMYIASPDNSRPMVAAVIEIMKGFWRMKGQNPDNLRYYSSAFLSYWLTQKYPNCEKVTKDSEVISMVEQGICMESKSALTSSSSSWSLRVVNKRKFDKGVYTYPADRGLSELIETYLNDDVEGGKKGSVRNKRMLEIVKKEIVDYIDSIGTTDTPMVAGINELSQQPVLSQNLG